MDKNRKKKKKKKTKLMDISYKELSRDIANFIIQSALQNKELYHKDNPLRLSNVAFWTEERPHPKTGEKSIHLLYTLHPKEWDVNEVIYDFENIKYQYIKTYNMIF